ncbi:MAG: hypothetical protein HKN13_07475 [Rhodothermales bacterium]|nr:hypothetical protein [Rhodothermales bacterium]
MNAVADIFIVGSLIGTAVTYLGWRGYQRFTSKRAACGGCGSECGGAPDKTDGQVLQSIELLTIVTAEDRLAGKRKSTSNV